MKKDITTFVTEQCKILKLEMENKILQVQLQLQNDQKHSSTQSSNQLSTLPSPVPKINLENIEQHPMEEIFGFYKSSSPRSRNLISRAVSRNPELKAALTKFGTKIRKQKEIKNKKVKEQPKSSSEEAVVKEVEDTFTDLFNGE